MKKYTKKEFFREMDREQSYYDHSLRARLLRYDSYFMSRYLYHLRMAEWHMLTPPPEERAAVQAADRVA